MGRYIVINITPTIIATITMMMGSSAGYDEMNRLKKANSLKGADLNVPDNYGMAASYNPMSNITRMTRQGRTNRQATEFGAIDDLDYLYQGNRLTAVNERAGVKPGGFIDGNYNTTDYAYDVNGNMTSDKNKSITNIEYNHLNLPDKINVYGEGGNVEMNYIYDAVETKLKKILPWKTVEYAGGYIYENGDLKFFPQDEGYIEPSQCL